MYTVGVRDHILVAHSLPHEAFGPAQRLHGATYTVSVEVEREELSDIGIVVDIGLLRVELRAVLADLDYSNLDDHPVFAGRLSTTEMLARHIHRELGKRLGATSGAMLTVTLDESPVAWARYRAPMRSASLPVPGEGM